jgi:hypothetical protein
MLSTGMFPLSAVTELHPIVNSVLLLLLPLVCCCLQQEAVNWDVSPQCRYRAEPHR